MKIYTTRLRKYSVYPTEETAFSLYPSVIFEMLDVELCVGYLRRYLLLFFRLRIPTAIFLTRDRACNSAEARIPFNLFAHDIRRSLPRCFINAFHQGRRPRLS